MPLPLCNRDKLDMTHRLCIAPMMDYTDRHFRYLLRLLAPHARLYTEMITARALLHGDAPRLLRFNRDEHPVALPDTAVPAVALVTSKRPEGALLIRRKRASTEANVPA